MAPAPRLVSFTLSFLVFGALAGYFGVLALGLVSSCAQDCDGFAALAVGGAAGATFALVLWFQTGLRSPFVSVGMLAVRLGLGLIAVGVWGGHIVADARPSTGGGAGSASFGGAVVALAMLPSSLAAFRGALRSGGTRRGSLIAVAARHRVRVPLAWTAVALGGASGAAAILGRASSDLRANAQLCLAATVVGAALAVIGWSLVDARFVRSEIERVAPIARRLEAARDGDDERLHPYDLGVGDARWSAVRPKSAHAYRAGRSAEMVMTGSLDAARFAIDESARVFRGALGRAGAAIALSVAIAGLTPLVALALEPEVALGESQFAKMRLDDPPPRVLGFAPAETRADDTPRPIRARAVGAAPQRHRSEPRVVRQVLPRTRGPSPMMVPLPF